MTRCSNIQQEDCCPRHSGRDDKGKNMLSLLSQKFIPLALEKVRSRKMVVKQHRPMLVTIGRYYRWGSRCIGNGTFLQSILH
uniref:Uncharacterized protein n=1 Tax=Romanomermis culicivorax TaxID=13658 RepID=A0A915JDI7_ROMCU